MWPRAGLKAPDAMDEVIDEEGAESTINAGGSMTGPRSNSPDPRPPKCSISSQIYLLP